MAPLFGSGRRGGRGAKGPAEAEGPASERQGFAKRAFELAEASAPPSRREFAAAVEAALAVLEAEDPVLRPRDSSRRPGGLLDLSDLPTVLVPDLHARPAFLASVFDWRPPLSPGRSSLASLLASGEANLVCLGDLFHSEAGGARERWLRAYREYASGWASREVMDEEMARSLAVARIVLEAKSAFPRNFHCLKGNHDNIADEEGRGDHGFYKFAAEGAMVASWFRESYGGALQARYRELELDLPVLALGARFAASHAEPAFALGREDAVEYRTRPEVVEALIWTPNDEAEPGSVARSLEALLGEDRAAGALWFAGHRPVAGRYALRAGGRFVQFHEPGSRRVAFLMPGRDPDPDRDILDLASD
jgi:hypothetical protein